jgi:hypothetical protein
MPERRHLSYNLFQKHPPPQKKIGKTLESILLIIFNEHTQALCHKTYSSIFSQLVLENQHPGTVANTMQTLHTGENRWQTNTTH